ncbi:MAG: hypothetical protein CMK59_06015 [Proteobacteria bacterium]|nr:hypothetical protein [Pseudomonadota bacterium]
MNKQDLILEKLAQAEQLLSEIRNLICEENPDIIELKSEPKHIQSTPEKLLESLFSLALEPPSQESLIEKLILLLHSDIGQNEVALNSLMRFNWSNLLRSVNSYLNNHKDPTSFEIVRKEERAFADVVELKVYLKASNRKPVPLNLRKDKDESWKIYSLSL